MAPGASAAKGGDFDGILGCCSSPHPKTLFAVHLWRFSGGYPALMDCMSKLRQNKVPPEWG